MSIMSENEVLSWLTQQQDRINNEANKRIIVRDLAGNEVKKIKSIKGESAPDVFTSLVESEGWAAEYLLKTLKVKGATLEELDADDEADSDSVVLNVLVKGKVTYKVTLEEV